MGRRPPGVAPTARAFIGHGTRQRPLQQLKELLDMWGAPYLVAQDEPHVGRTLYEKVSALMGHCAYGIFLCTSDDRIIVESTGATLFQPRQNVILELGLALSMYDRRVVICKEDNVILPTNCSNLGFIGFRADNLYGSAEELRRELAAIGITKAVRPVPPPRTIAHGHVARAPSRGPTGSLPEGAVSPTPRRGSL